LNICAPYTSRDEITTAIRKTVTAYSEPIRPPLKRPFSETHIARNIRAQQLSTVSEGEASDAATILSLENVEDEAPEDDIIYNPSNDESRNTFEAMMDIVSKNTISSRESPAVNDIIRLVSSSILRSLKDDSLTDEQKVLKIKDILPDNTPSSDIDELVELSVHIKDFNHPAESTIASGSTTLNTSAERNNTSPGPQNYPDPEIITEDTITAHTFTGTHTPPLDILIRTSGVERLSDFMLWQCHQDTEIVFLKCLWPEFDLWHFLPVLLEWQWSRTKEGWMERRPRHRKVD
jgi:undecaprenyl diphosphate synthase